MALSVFADKASPPKPRTLAAALGRAAPMWSALTGGLASAHGPLTEEWHYAGASYGWSLRLKKAKRTLVYLIPGDRQFLAGFVLGDRACLAAHEARLPAAALAALDAAPKYAEGRGLRLTVRTARDLKTVRALAEIKIAN